MAPLTTHACARWAPDTDAARGLFGSEGPFEREEGGSDKPEIGTEIESEALAAAGYSSSCVDKDIQ
jgi:hypothetical protein